MNTIIKLIKCDNTIYNSEIDNIEVHNLPSYLMARKKYEKYKNSQKKFEIIIVKKNLFNFFLDIEENSRVEIILKKGESNIPLDKLKRLGVYDLEEFEKTSNIGDHLEERVLNYHFKDKFNLFKLLDLLGKIETVTNDLKCLFWNKYFSNYSNNLKFLFMNDLLEFKDVLLQCLIFSKYKRLNYNILINDKELESEYEFFNSNDTLWSMYLNEKKNLSLEKLNIYLKNESNKLRVFSEFNDYYFKNISGELTFEKEFFLNHFFSKLNKNIDINELSNLYNKYFNKFNDQDQNIINLLDKLLKLENIEINNYNLKQWKDFFKSEYNDLKNDLDEIRFETMISNCENLYHIDLKDLKKSITEKFEKINEYFEEYFLKNYNKLMSSENREGLDYKLIEIKKELSKTNNKILFIFIDALRYDIWKKYISSFEEIGYFNQTCDDITLSSIPTVTSHCKNILYSGKKYNQINESPLKEMKDFFYEYNIKQIKNIHEIDDSNDLFLYEILDLDKACHDFGDLNYNFIKAILDKSLKSILEYIKDKDFSVVIGTDHGFTKLNPKNLKSIDFKNYLNQKNLEITNHGRYFKITSDYFDETIYNNLIRKFEEDNIYHIIKKDELDYFYLDKRQNNKIVYCYVVYKNGYFPYNHSSFNHGGINLEEVMIPFSILSKQRKTFEDIQVEIITKEIYNDKLQDIQILIKNNNNISNLNIKIIHLEKSMTISEIDSNKIINIPIILKGRLGEFIDTLKIEFEFDGEIKSYKYPLNLIIKENSKNKLNKKLKKSRSLL